MARNGQKLKIEKNQAGFITVYGRFYTRVVDGRKMTKFEQFEAVRWTILNMGVLFDEKTERLVRKELEK